MYLHVFIHHEYCNKKKVVRNERSATFWNNFQKKKKENATELKVSCALTHFLFPILVNVVKTPLSVSKNGPKALGTCTKAIKFRRNIRHHRHRH